MSYLLDKKIKRNKYFKYIIFVIVLFILIYFKNGIFRGLSYVSSVVFHPVLTLGNNIGGTFSGTSAYFYSKNSLLRENENLKLQLSEQEARMANYNSVLDENLKMKEILGRLSAQAGKITAVNMVLAGILAKPNQSPYDTLVIDVGAKDGILLGQKVFALGNIPIGRVAEVDASSAKVILYSNSGEKTEVVITGKDTFMQIIGRGGGNFEMILPRDFILDKGTEVVLPGITPYTVATVQTIISDPRDAFQKALLMSPVNISELKFVEVEK